MIGRNLILFSSLFTLLFIASVNTIAQDSIPLTDDIFTTLHSNANATGEITLYQDASINVLVDKHKRINKKRLKGYRIQIYRGSGQQARENANDNSQVFIEAFPEFNTSQIYAIYESPYFKLRVGDYRTKNEAFELLYKVKEIFPNAYIVATNIKFPKLEVASPAEPAKENE